MTTEQIAIQLVNINEALQILARNNVTVEHHSHSIESIIEKNKDYDIRIRDIESLIHQSCDLKTKEMNESAKRIHERIDDVAKESKNTSLLYTAAIATVGMILFGLVWKTDSEQDANNDKLYSEIFGVLRNLQSDMSDIKSNLAVINTNQKHYEEELHKRKGE